MQPHCKAGTCHLQCLCITGKCCCNRLPAGCIYCKWYCKAAAIALCNPAAVIAGHGCGRLQVLHALQIRRQRPAWCTCNDCKCFYLELQTECNSRCNDCKAGSPLQSCCMPCAKQCSRSRSALQYSALSLHALTRGCGDPEGYMACSGCRRSKCKKELPGKLRAQRRHSKYTWLPLQAAAFAIGLLVMHNALGWVRRARI